MTQHDFRTASTGAGLIGTVTYRCAQCSDLIDGAVAFVSPT
jgi:hypothetical protein